MARKVIVKVVAEFDVTGKVRPLSIEWEDGRVFKIDRLVSAKMAASTKVGGQGMRYTCRIKSKEIYLFNDDGIWFVPVETDMGGKSKLNA